MKAQFISYSDHVSLGKNISESIARLLTIEDTLQVTYTKKTRCLPAVRAVINALHSCACLLDTRFFHEHPEKATSDEYYPNVTNYEYAQGDPLCEYLINEPQRYPLPKKLFPGTHRVCGDLLRNVNSAMSVPLCNIAARAYGLSSVEHKALLKVRSKLLRLRSVMDDLVHKEYPEVATTSIYF